MEGELTLKSLIKASGKTQAQVAAEIGTDPTYISQMANGKVNWVNSAYFPALVGVLGLNFTQVRSLRPDAITDIAAAAAKAGIATHTQPPNNEKPTPELAEMLERYAVIDDELSNPEWRRFLASLPVTAQNTAKDWYALFVQLKEMGLNPEKAC